MFLIIPFKIFSQDSLYFKIKNDKDFLVYKQTEYIIKEGLIAKRFIIPKNFRELAIQNGKQVDEVTLIKLLEKEGMNNAKEYIELIKKQNMYMIKTLQKYPELNSMLPSEKNKLLMRLLSSN
jgi:hypothetical protein